MVRTLLCAALVASFLPLAAAGQGAPPPAAEPRGSTQKKIKSIYASETEVFEISAAVGLNTLIQLQDTVTQAFLGDPNLFHMEVLDKTVAIKPREEFPNAATSLTVITKSGRITFMLSVDDPRKAILIVDVKPPNSGIAAPLEHNKRIKAKIDQLEQEREEQKKTLTATAENMARQFMIEAVAQGVAVESTRDRERKNDIVVKVSQAVHLGPMTLYRLVIQNKSDITYKVGEVSVGVCEHRVFGRCKEPRPLSNTDTYIPTDPIVPGQEAVAAIGFPTPDLKDDEELAITTSEAPGGKDREVTVEELELDW